VDTLPSLVGASGHIAVHRVTTSTGDPAFCIEQVELGEVVDLPDLATARELYDLLGLAIAQASAVNMVQSYPDGGQWLDTGSGMGWPR
jgi:hypothetical protein